MSWKEEVKKEKFQGPQTKYGGYASPAITVYIRDLNYYLERLEEKFKVNPDSWKDREIETYIENMRRLVDKMDEKLVNQAKYGDSRGVRADEKWIGNYSAKRNSPLAPSVEDEE
jgi:GTP-dependent phosphoenolpyruvate carboxykinase